MKKHGEWISIIENIKSPFSFTPPEIPVIMGFKCSVCERKVDKDKIKGDCVCGAKMDGGKAE